MKKVLFISDVFSKGGLETRLSEEANFYKKHKIDSYLICDTFEKNAYSSYFKEIISDIKLQPTNNSLTGEQIIQASIEISKFCTKHNIDLIECQPFWGIIPAILAAKKCNLPIIYTIHGSKSGNFIDFSSLGPSLLFYLSLYFGIDSVIVVSEYLSHLYRHLPQEKIVLPNGISKMPTSAKHTIKPNGVFAIASRVDPPKTDTILSFLPQLYNSKYSKSIDIYGDGLDLPIIKKMVSDNHFEDKVNFCGWAPNLSLTLENNKYDCVFGLGRVITDSIGASTPAGIVGYGGFSGIVSKQNIQYYLHNNFISWNQTSPTLLDEELTKLYKTPSDYLFNKSDLEHISSDYFWNMGLEKLKEVKHTSNSTVNILEDLLVTHKNSDIINDKTISDSLLKIIQSLDKNTLIYTGFVDILISTNRNLQQTITQLTNDIKNMQESTSWKITSPLRKIKDHLTK